MELQVGQRVQWRNAVKFSTIIRIERNTVFFDDDPILHISTFHELCYYSSTQEMWVPCPLKGDKVQWVHCGDQEISAVHFNEENWIDFGDCILYVDTFLREFRWEAENQLWKQLEK